MTYRFSFLRFRFMEVCVLLFVIVEINKYVNWFVCVIMCSVYFFNMVSELLLSWLPQKRTRNMWGILNVIISVHINIDVWESIFNVWNYFWSFLFLFWLPFGCPRVMNSHINSFSFVISVFYFHGSHAQWCMIFFFHQRSLRTTDNSLQNAILGTRL